jgi:hypothetical protein
LLLKVSIQVYHDETARGAPADTDWSVIKVSKALYQFQTEPGMRRWVFRYEYLRNPPDHHPSAHMHVRADLKEEEVRVLPDKEVLEDVHFPTERVSLEAIIRLLVDHFGIRCATPEAVWRPALLASEDAFREMQDSPRNPRQAEPARRKRRS